MSNINRICGASLISKPFGGRTAGNPYLVIATDATALFMGDFVKLTGESAQWSDGMYYPVITQAAATDITVGFVTGFHPHPDYLNQLYRTGLTLRLVYVEDDPMAVLEIQSDGTFVAGDVGQTADVAVGAGSTVTGLSGMYLNHASLGDDKQLKIIGVSQRVNSELGSYTKVVCINNKHSYKTITAGV